MNNIRSAFSWGSVILCLSLVSALCEAGTATSQTAYNAAPPGSYSAAALYNLGNAYAREGKPALAVLNYERAQLLAPQDPDIRANLQHVRDSASIPSAPSGFAGHFRLLSPNATYWLGLMGLFVAGICGLLLALRRFPRALIAGSLGGALIMVAYALTDAVATAQVMREAVVMQTVSASASPIANTDALFSVPSAALVEIEDQHGDFLLIRDAQGNVGWVPRNELVSIIDSKGDVHA